LVPAFEPANMQSAFISFLAVEPIESDRRSAGAVSAYSFAIARPITSRWMSLAPS
jgi:hypothetical protein